jgi:hypothetical protein
MHSKHNHTVHLLLQVAAAAAAAAAVSNSISVHTHTYSVQAYHLSDDMSCASSQPELESSLLTVQ